MPRSLALVQTSPDVQSWVDNIPLGTLGQSSQSRETIQTSSVLNLHHNTSGLSVSQHSSNHSISQSRTPVNGTGLATRSVPNSLDTPAHATNSSHPRSWRSYPPNVGLEARTPSLSPSNNSLIQLETAGIPPEAQLSLPSSRSGSPNSATTATGTPVVLSSLEQLSQLEPVDPSSIPLPADAEPSIPQSQASSHGSTTSFRSAHAFDSSLEQLRNLHPLAASAVPLPASDGSGSVGVTRSAIVASSNDASHIPVPDKRDYWQKIEPLTHFMPHLKNIFPPKGRHRYAGKATCIDYLSNGDSRAGIEIDMSYVRSRSGREMMTDRLKELRIVEDPTVSSRIILVEDLCSESMEILGTTFGLDPEMFAEHLNKSGYDAEDYSETDAERWNTSHLAKDFVAMTWCRPVYQNPLLTDWLRAPRRLLNEDEDVQDGMSSVTWRDPTFTITGKRIRSAREHRLRVETNVFRRSWSLSARTTGFDSQPRTGDRKPKQPLDNLRSTLVPTAWQERASFCCVQGEANIPIGKHPELLTCRFWISLNAVRYPST
jgi:hypothetical protein